MDPKDTSLCPEWCEHPGECAVIRAGINAAESYAENAWLRAAEAPSADDDWEREREAYDDGLAQMRERQAELRNEDYLFAREERRMRDYDDGIIWAGDR